MQKIIETILEFLGDIVGGIVDILVSFLMQTWMIPYVNSCKNFGDSVFSGFVDRAIQVLRQSPEEWNPDAWAFIMQKVNVVFVAFGCQLVVLFFLMGFLQDSVDARRDVRIETIIKALFKILVAEYLVTNSINIVTGLFSFIGDLTGGYAGGTYAMPAWAVKDAAGETIEFNTALENMGGGYFLLTLIFALIYMIVMIGSGAMIVYTAYMRFFKVMVIVPYGAIASSTIAGNSAMSHTAMQFYKYVLGVVLEAVTVIVAIGVFSAVAGGTQFEFIQSAADADAAILLAFINRSLAALLLVGVVRGAGALTQRVLGL